MWLYERTDMFYSCKDGEAWSFTSLIGLCFDSVFELFPVKVEVFFVFVFSIVEMFETCSC